LFTLINEAPMLNIQTFIKNIVSKFAILLLLLFIMQSISDAQTGTWAKVTTLAPHDNMGVMLLLTDGTVLVHNSSGPGDGTGWDKLTPDAYGSYVHGTWSSVASMHYDRLFFPSQVLPSGKVFVAGGENGSGDGDTTAEVYDPVANTWTVTGRVPGTEYGKPAGTPQNIYDGNSEILPDGRILVGTQIGPSPSYDCLFFNPDSNNWRIAPTALYNHDEAAWLKLPDSSILFIGIASEVSCRYRPQTNTWVKDAAVPVEIYDRYGEESGSACLLPNGKAIFFGASKYNAIYTPSGKASPGSWAAGPDFPSIEDSLVGQVDAAGAMMVNGHVLLAVSPEGASASEEFRLPVYFLEYDYVTNSFTQVTSTIPGMGGDSLAAVSCNLTNFLDLPDGTVLFGHEEDSGASNQYYIYTPGSGPIPQGKPTINSILPDSCPFYKITGKMFNGISEGSSYGDDWQNSTNWPLVRLTNAAGNVYYCKTTDWNRIGAVMTDSLEDTAVFETPATLPAGTYSLIVVVNGFASNPIIFSTLTETALVNSDPTNGSSTGTASCIASGGTSPYIYFWTGGAGTNSTASGLNPGTYTITVTDNNGCSDTASVKIINQVAIYPDPNDGTFTIVGVSQGQTIELFNYLGQKLSSMIANDAVVKFDISGKANGVYMVKILSENGSVLMVKKFVKIE
jgi:hypothetical protein